MSGIFRVDEHDLPWFEYGEATGPDGGAAIKVKGLTVRHPEVPPVQYIEYAPGHTDPVHSHDTGEVFVIVAGELFVNDERSGPGSIVFVPRDVEYAVRAGATGVRYFRVVVDAA